jgi:hypothetical protein
MYLVSLNLYFFQNTSLRLIKSLNDKKCFESEMNSYSYIQSRNFYVYYGILLRFFA